jgi:hypothetical protein
VVGNWSLARLPQRGKKTTFSGVCRNPSNCLAGAGLRKFGISRHYAQIDEETKRQALAKPMDWGVELRQRFI